jgi:putative membrane protein
MTHAITDYAPFLSFITYFALAFAFLFAFTIIYQIVTPHNEVSLIRGGNVSAAYQFSGMLLGFSIPLYSALTHSVGIVDFAVWATVALVVQVGTFGLVNLMFGNLSKQIQAKNVAVGIVSGAVSIAAGIINAACMSY